MTPCATLPLPAEPTVTAPDGSHVRVLLGLAGGTMAHFTLPAGATAKAVVHRTVEEIWYVTSGRGEMWRRQGGDEGADGDAEEGACEGADESVVALVPGLCLTIPLGTRFQFRAAADRALEAVAITMPPWPGDGEAVEVPGPWTPSV